MREVLAADAAPEVANWPGFTTPVTGFIGISGRKLLLSDTRPIYEYRVVTSLEEVNQICDSDGYELLQAVVVAEALQFVVRRPRPAGGGRQVGFARALGEEPGLR